MWLQPLKNQSTHHKQQARQTPEIDREPHVFKKPALHQQGFPVTVRDVKEWVEVNQVAHFPFQPCVRPNDRRKPKEQRDEDGDDLLHVPNKHHDGRCQPADAHHQQH